MIKKSYQNGCDKTVKTFVGLVARRHVFIVQIWLKDGKKKTISYLCHGDNIRNHILCLKTPVMASCSTKSRLNFIGNADTTSFTYHFINRFQIARGQFNCSPNSLYFKSRFQLFTNIYRNLTSYKIKKPMPEPFFNNGGRKTRNKGKILFNNF